MKVRGVITAEPGRILGDSVFVIQDSTGGIAVRGAGDLSALGRGTMVQVTGALASPYGNAEVRPADGGIELVGPGSLPPARLVPAAELGETTEGLLVQVAGTVELITRTSTSITLMLRDDTGEARVVADAARISGDDLEKGQELAATGIGGQRASGRDRPDGYRVWVRDDRDLVILDAPQASPTPRMSPTPRPTNTPRPSATPRPTHSPRPPARPSPTKPRPRTPNGPITIRQALAATGGSVTIAGVVTSPVGLLDADGRRVTVEDSSGGVLVRLAPDGAVPALGDRLRVTGTVGAYYGAPQLGADEPGTVLGHGAAPSPLRVAVAPLPSALEWRLVELRGRLDSVHKYGDSWRAELVLASGASVPISGGPRSGITVTAVVQGRQATVRGIVKRPYPTASDQRFGLVPRSPADISLGAPTSSDDASGGGGTVSGGTRGGSGGRGGTTGHAGGGSTRDTPNGAGAANLPGGVPAGGRPGGDPQIPGEETIPDVTLSQLADHDGALVRTGGIIAAVDGLLVTLEDGPDQVLVRLPAGAESLAALLAPGEPLNVTGVLRRGESGWEIVPRSISDVARVGGLGEIVPLDADLGTGPASTATPDPDAAGRTAASLAPPSAGGGFSQVPLLLVAAVLVALLGAVPRGRLRAGVSSVARRLSVLKTRLPGPDRSP